jgi:hypothetical protein
MNKAFQYWLLGTVGLFTLGLDLAANPQEITWGSDDNGVCVIDQNLELSPANCSGLTIEASLVLVKPGVTVTLSQGLCVNCLAENCKFTSFKDNDDACGGVHFKGWQDDPGVLTFSTKKSLVFSDIDITVENLVWKLGSSYPADSNSYHVYITGSSKLTFPARTKTYLELVSMDCKDSVEVNIGEDALIDLDGRYSFL